jgi:lysophospholipase L1-like esterase
MHRKVVGLMVASLVSTASFAAEAPSIFIAGDSTAQPGGPGAIGWGKPFAALFDPAKVNLVNSARGGRSSRTFVAEGLWDGLLAGVKTGDYVLIQFGHNDGGPINGERIARGSLPGLGDETQEIDNLSTKQHETVHTFGWYMRKMITETKSKGAMPILLSLTVRNIWADGHVERGSGKYGEWTRELAQSEHVAFIDLTSLVADRYERMGADAVKPFFPRDHTHTSDEGAELNSRMVLAGLKALHENGILRALSAAGQAVEIAPPGAVMVADLGRPPRDRAAFLHWLNLPEPADPALPSLVLIGDSTVRNGRGDAVDGQWGWGDPLTVYFDPAKINVVNRAVGGTGSRSFISQDYWDMVLAMLKPGDIVIMQFGHNDNGPRGPLRGIGEQTEERDGAPSGPGGAPPGPRETIRTYGWYLRKYISETRAKGATPIVCSLIPRNIWEDGKIARPRDSHADWARDVAKAEGAAFLDLYETIAERYDQLGQQAVTALFADQRVHTTRAGAELNARCVISALHRLAENPVAKFERATPEAVW